MHHIVGVLQQHETGQSTGGHAAAAFDTLPVQDLLNLPHSNVNDMQHIAGL